MFEIIDPTYIKLISKILLASCNTLYIATFATILGIIIAVVLYLGKNSINIFIKKSCYYFCDFIIGIPELVILFGFYFSSIFILTKIFGNYTEINNKLAGIITLAIIFGAYASDILISAYKKINLEQINSAHILGLSKFFIFYKIIAPQLIKYSLPGLSNLALVLLKDTALLSLIGVEEILSKTKIAATNTFNPLFFYLFAAFIYLSFSLIIEKITNKLNNYYHWEKGE